MQNYIALIDLEKAGKDAVLYTLLNQGMKGKFGLTDEVIVNDNLRQGKPFWRPEFACFIDNLNWQLLAGNLGIRYLYLTNTSLLFMGDIPVRAEREWKLTEMPQVNDNCISNWQLKVNGRCNVNRMKKV